MALTAQSPIETHMFFRKKKRTAAAQAPPQPEPKSAEQTPGVVQSILLAYGIVVLHLSLIAMICLLVLVLSGVVHYFVWLLLGGLAALYGGIWYFLRKMRNERDAIRNILGLPEFRNKTVEISLFGGAASLKVGNRPDEAVNIKSIGASSTPLLTDKTDRSRLEDLGELSRLYDNGMITREEFEQLKLELMSRAMGRESRSSSS